MQLRGKKRFLVALVVSALIFIIAWGPVFNPAYSIGINNNLIIVYPPPGVVIFWTLLVVGVWYGMYRWYRRDPVKHALSTLNEAERRALLHELTRETPLRLHTDDGELLDLQAEDAPPPRKRKREMVE